MSHIRLQIALQLDSVLLDILINISVFFYLVKVNRAVLNFYLLYLILYLLYFYLEYSNV